ncbi:hypothetical protein C9426_20410 [Serratia sp. S1B]|nr:hypothetical protein C9426_20410 [Serratia sp. S1B]
MKPWKLLTFILVGICGVMMAVFASIVTMARPETMHAPARLEGIFWQPDQLSSPSGAWDLLGIHTFVTQWSVVDNKAWMSSIPDMDTWADLPDWQKVQRQRWAQHIVLGLAGAYKETDARENLQVLVKQSQQLLRDPLEVQASDYYFPVEADPSWSGVYELGHVLANFNRPIWVSIYSADPQAQNLDLWLSDWLPSNAKVFFQDGVGVGTRTPEQAAIIYQRLVQRFGTQRVVIILEAFRHKRDGSFRAAYPWELIAQLKAYEGQRVYIFDGPHYLNRASVYWLYTWMHLHYAKL